MKILIALILYVTQIPACIYKKATRQLSRFFRRFKCLKFSKTVASNCWCLDKVKSIFTTEKLKYQHRYT